MLPGVDVLMQTRQDRPFVSLDPTGDGGYGVFTAAPLPGRAPSEEPLVLVGQYAIPDRLAKLAEGVQSASAQYGRLTYQRPYLKGTFALTLTMVLLLSLLAAVYGALFWAQRLVQPVQDLIAGTRAVAKGDFETRLSLPSRDEIGFLVTSFNEMTKRLARARVETEQSRAAVEKERANLATVLARLSTGVIAFEPDLHIRSMNAAAGSILGVDPEQTSGLTLSEASQLNRWLGQFLDRVGERLQAGQAEWREQVPIHDEGSRRELMCACTALPVVGETAGGFVVVFDDITTLLQAQRDAAWGEVARRLAHEIKNPLTPIQLSAERMRRKFLGSMNEKDAQVLERATHTIVQQVEAMKGMVNAFSEYARAPQLVLEPFDLNALVAEVAELYRAGERPVQVELALEAGLEAVEADRGRVRQILSNLLKNAMEALEGTPDPQVHVATRRAEWHGQPVVQIEVVDNGPGFQRELMGQVFDPYVTSKPKGTGLGLAIVKKVVEEHGGRIEAHNGPEGGASVLVALPLNEESRAQLGTRETRKSEPRRERA
jgi:nitrogen fixation/metabolism regulation signal transduction histidine kinase